MDEEIRVTTATTPSHIYCVLGLPSETTAQTGPSAQEKEEQDEQVDLTMEPEATVGAKRKRQQRKPKKLGRAVFTAHKRQKKIDYTDPETYAPDELSLNRYARLSTGVSGQVPSLQFLATRSWGAYYRTPSISIPFDCPQSLWTLLRWNLHSRQSLLLWSGARINVQYVKASPFPGITWEVEMPRGCAVDSAKWRYEGGPRGFWNPTYTTYRRPRRQTPARADELVPFPAMLWANPQNEMQGYHNRKRWPAIVRRKLPEGAPLLARELFELIWHRRFASGNGLYTAYLKDGLDYPEALIKKHCEDVQELSSAAHHRHRLVLRSEAKLELFYGALIWLYLQGQIYVSKPGRGPSHIGTLARYEDVPREPITSVEQLSVQRDAVTALELNFLSALEAVLDAVADLDQDLGGDDDEPADVPRSSIHQVLALMDPFVVDALLYVAVETGDLCNTLDDDHFGSPITNE